MATKFSRTLFQFGGKILKVEELYKERLYLSVRITGIITLSN